MNIAPQLFPTLVIKNDLTILAANEWAAELFKLSCDLLLGKEISWLFCSSQKETNSLTKIRKLFSLPTEGRVAFYQACLDGNGEKIHILFNGKKIEKSNGGYVIVFSCSDAAVLNTQ